MKNKASIKLLCILLCSVLLISCNKNKTAMLTKNKDFKNNLDIYLNYLAMDGINKKDEVIVIYSEKKGDSTTFYIDLIAGLYDLLSWHNEFIDKLKYRDYNIILRKDFPNNIVEIYKNKELKIEDIYNEFYSKDYEEFKKDTNIPPPPNCNDYASMRIIFNKQKMISSGLKDGIFNQIDSEVVEPEGTYLYSYPALNPILKNAYINPNEKLIYTFVEEMPKFPEGEETIITFLQKKMNYPKEAKKKKIEGTVYISFIVDINGKITNVETIRGIGGGCEEEATRVIKMMPDWIPGKQVGKNVRVKMIIPIKFQGNK